VLPPFENRKGWGSLASKNRKHRSTSFFAFFEDFVPSAVKALTAEIAKKIRKGRRESLGKLSMIRSLNDSILITSVPHLTSWFL
jgi:hypothetical protein